MHDPAATVPALISRLADFVVHDARFEAACQRYARENGASKVIALRALRIALVEHYPLVGQLLEAVAAEEAEELRGSRPEEAEEGKYSCSTV